MVYRIIFPYIRPWLYRGWSYVREIPVFINLQPVGQYSVDRADLLAVMSLCRATTEEFSRDTMLDVTYNGTVSWYPHRRFESWCSFDLTHYPFDNHTCNLLFGSWTHPVKVNISSMLSFIPFSYDFLRCKHFDDSSCLFVYHSQTTTTTAAAAAAAATATTTADSKIPAYLWWLSSVVHELSQFRQVILFGICICMDIKIHRINV